MKTILLLFSLLFSTSVFTQQKIDGVIPFQTDPAKKYSIYVPSSYDANSASKLMVGFHPFNTNRWDAKAWRDTLTYFAEMNDLILICPDGGADGRVDDDIDTAFTSFLIDSSMHWFNIDIEEVFAIGFSVGGLTTYTYGLNHIDKFKGFIPIGAAVNGTNDVNGVIQNAKDIPYYIVHGGSDNANVRFWPIRDALDNNGACVQHLLMPFVGHTIDFPNRNQILTDAFNWVDSVSCGVTTGIEIVEQTRISIAPNPVPYGSGNILINDHRIFEKVQIFSQTGKIVSEEIVKGNAIKNLDLPGGIYTFLFWEKENRIPVKVIFQ